MSLKGRFQEFLQANGVLLRRFNKFQSEIHQVVKACERSNCCILIDVGANTGQFAEACRKAGFLGEIISFEPQSVAYATLCQKAKTHSNWRVAPRCAVGDKQGRTQIKIAENSVSSSLLDVTAISTSANKLTKFISTEDVDVMPLDELLTAYVPKGQRVALKIDTQGYEDAVLRGASSALEYIDVLYLEMSLVPLYIGAPLFQDLFRIVTSYNFKCIGIFPGFTDQRTFEVLQVNGLFRRATGARSID